MSKMLTSTVLTAEVEHELAKCHANLPAIVGDQLHKSWIFSVVVGVAKKKKTLFNSMWC